MNDEGSRCIFVSRMFFSFFFFFFFWTNYLFHKIPQRRQTTTTMTITTTAITTHPNVSTPSNDASNMRNTGPNDAIKSPPLDSHHHNSNSTHHQHHRGRLTINGEGSRCICVSRPV